MKRKAASVLEMSRRGVRIKKMVVVLLTVTSLGFGISTYYGLCGDAASESSLAERHLDNLHLLMGDLLVDLSPTKEEILRGATVDSSASKKAATTGTITGSTETYHATIYSYEGAGIPDFLIDNFDRIFRMIADYVNLRGTNDRVVVWVMDLKTLRKIPFGPQSAANECPRNLVALYVSIFDYLLFTTQYINDYYVTHELLHYYIDEHEEEVAAALHPVIKQKNIADLPLQSFLKHDEERIVIQLSKIIIRSGEHSFLYRKR
ncbi:hypothetical protein ES702_05125 [subsurface metagenome]